MTDSRFTLYRDHAIFADNEDSLLDLSDDELRDLFTDLLIRLGRSLADLYPTLPDGRIYYSDSHVDDANQIQSLINHCINITYNEDFTTPDTYTAFLNALDAGLADDLTYLLTMVNFDTDAFDDAPIFRHYNLIDED